MTDTIRDQTMTIHVLDLAGNSRTIEGTVGSSLMEIIHAAGTDDIPAFCGGCCSCASCHAHVDAAFLPMLPAMSTDEADVLDGAEGPLRGGASVMPASRDRGARWHPVDDRAPEMS